MNKQTFLKQLNKSLRHIPKEDRLDAINYYTEYFQEMDVDDTQDISDKIDTPENIAKEIILNCTEKHIELQEKEGGIKNSATTVWMIILGIFAAPLALPLALTAFLLLASFLLVIACLLLSAFLASGSLAVFGLLLLTSVFFVTSFSQGLVCLGIALVSLGIGIILIGGMIELTELIVKATSSVFQKIFNRKKVS